MKTIQENLEIIIHAKFIEPTQDVEGLFMLETIRQAIAYMPSIGELQRQQIVSSSYL
jgi:hypothetical protein